MKTTLRALLVALLVVVGLSALLACSMPVTHTITIKNTAETEGQQSFLVKAGEVVIESGNLVDPSTEITVQYEAELGYFAMLYIDGQLISDALSPQTLVVDKDTEIEVKYIQTNADAVKVTSITQFDLEAVDEEGFEGAYLYKEGAVEGLTEFKYSFDRPVGQSGKILFVFKAQGEQIEDIYLLGQESSQEQHIWNVLGNREANPLLNETQYLGYWGAKSGNVITAANEQNTIAQGTRQFAFKSTVEGQFEVTMEVIDLNNQNAVLSSYSVLFIVQ